MNYIAALYFSHMVLLAGVETASVQCDVPGFDHLIDDLGRGIIVIGELHGTEEGPALLSNLACAAITRNLRTAVLFEAPGQFDEILNSTPGRREAAQAHLCEHMEPFWAWSRDGRGTHALLSAWVNLAEMRGSSANGLTLGAHDLSWGRSEAHSLSQHAKSRAAAMTERISKALSDHAIVIVNVGAAHPTRIRERLLVDAAYDGRPITRVAQRFSGGQAWNCQRSRCQTHDIPGRYRGPASTPGVVRTETIRNYDAVVHLGDATASPALRETDACD
ncbi:hypothetical protein F1654_12940 [Alkalicaulis satelles]|uniref:ChaN family lipoprotein n=1 Tax=Alkalicaulis satelles TaxID=2609175 RepID=A0A5M6ZAL4_9PROT|nr:hypothetical protein [Alkalicaulis satelles]KAA5800964.1 hypothetical protein F1654_12940 [Alkalicaulis satelles]